MVPSEDRSPNSRAQAHHREVVGRDHPGDLLGLHVQEAQVVVAGLPRKPGAAEDGHRCAPGPDPDPAAEEEVHRTPLSHGEVAGVLEEEGPLLGEEEVEPGEVDLLVVHLHLGEVGVVGEVHVEARGDADLGVHAEIGVRLHLDFGGVVAAGRSERVGRDLEVPGAAEFQPVQFARRGEPVEVVDPRHRRPVVLLALAADVAVEVEPPGLRARSVAERPQRDRELGGPALVRHLGGHPPARVPVHVESAAGPGASAHLRSSASAPATAAGVAQLAVVLEPRRGGPKDEAVLEVVVGVEDDPEGVRVLQIGVAPGVGGDDARRIAVVEHRADIDRLVVEEDPDFSALGGGLALEGFGLHEVGQRLGGRPDVFVEPAVDGRRLERGKGAADAGAGRRFVFGTHAEPGPERQGAEREQGEGREAHNRSNLPRRTPSRTSAKSRRRDGSSKTHEGRGTRR